MQIEYIFPDHYTTPGKQTTDKKRRLRGYPKGAMVSLRSSATRLSWPLTGFRPAALRHRLSTALPFRIPILRGNLFGILIIIILLFIGMSSYTGPAIISRTPSYTSYSFNFFRIPPTLKLTACWVMPSASAISCWVKPASSSRTMRQSLSGRAPSATQRVQGSSSS